MQDDIRDLVQEILYEDELQDVELRLSLSDVAILESEYGATCQKMDILDSNDSKTWYLVHFPA